MSILMRVQLKRISLTIVGALLVVSVFNSFNRYLNDINPADAPVTKGPSQSSHQDEVIKS